MKNSSKFIGAFVSNMYSILLGIGISNIIFVQQINLKDMYENIMALFVISVLLIYWWDWTEYIEDQVKTTKLEFSINFFILLTLEMLFAYYNDVEFLSGIFLFLGIIDLIWVVNHIHELKHEGVFSTVRAIRWYAEKIVIIIIYSVPYIIINYFDIIDNIYIKSGLIIAGFIISRYVGFKQVKSTMKFYFSEATENDADKIAEINNDHYNRTSEQGFMISKLCRTDVIKRIASEDYRYFVAKSSSGDIIGFVEVGYKSDDNILSNLLWTDESYKYLVENKKYSYIEKIAVRQGFNRKGIGEFLYKSLFSELPSTVFAAFVVNKPYQNIASIKFHQKMGFNGVAVYRTEQFMGIKDYESIFYIKAQEDI